MKFAPVVQGLITTAAIAYAIRWFSTTAADESPRVRGDTKVYGIRRRVRIVFYGAALFLPAIVFFAGRDQSISKGHWSPDVWDFLLLGLAVTALALAMGEVTTDQNGIKKRSWWHSVSIPWAEIVEVKLRKRDGGAIEIRGSSQKLIVDSRFAARAYLQNEIGKYTNLEPVRDRNLRNSDRSAG